MSASHIAMAFAAGASLLSLAFAVRKNVRDQRGSRDNDADAAKADADRDGKRGLCVVGAEQQPNAESGASGPNPHGAISEFGERLWSGKREPENAADDWNHDGSSSGDIHAPILTAVRPESITPTHSTRTGA